VLPRDQHALGQRYAGKSPLHRLRVLCHKSTRAGKITGAFILMNAPAGDNRCRSPLR
jgi:hypothetical protein